MLTILDLPNELVGCIIDAIPDADFEAFAFTNKAIYAIARAAPDRYYTLKRRYSTLETGEFMHGSLHDDNLKPDDCKDALLFLGSLLKDPTLAHFPRNIRFGYCRSHSSAHPPREVSEDLRVKRESFLQHHFEELTRLVDECGLLSLASKPDMVYPTSWLRAQDEKTEAFILLTLLPNLKSINLMSRMLVGPYLMRGGLFAAPVIYHDVVCRAAQANRDTEDPCHDKIFSQLEEIFVDSMDPPAFASTREYGNFIMLPSLRRLIGRHLEGRSFNIPDGFAPQASTLTEINITRSSVGWVAFENLLEHIPALQKFTYEDAGGDMEQGMGPERGAHPYQPVRIINVLRRHAAHSLELLDIVGHDNASSAHQYEDGRIGSLRMFDALKSIRLEDFYFFCGLSSSQYRLVDVLPSSVEHFTLVALIEEEHRRVLLEGLPELEPEMLPNLKAFTLE